MVLRRFNKRAVFFTLASMFFVAALFLIFNASKPTEPYNTKLNQIYTLNEYREKLENVYIPLLTRHAGYQALYRDSQEALARGAFPPTGYLNLPRDWNETVWHGTLRGVAVPGYTSLPQQFVNLQTATKQLGYNLTIQLLNITLAQSGPYQASYTVNVTFTLGTPDNTTYYARNVSEAGTISLVGIPDLYYNRHASAAGIVDRKFFKPYLALGGWSNEATLNLSQQGAYRAANQTGDIFGRLQGSVATSKWGIETILPASVVVAGNLTSIDWQYFTNTQFRCTYSQAAIYPNLRMSLQSVFDYNITAAANAYNDGSCAAAP